MAKDDDSSEALHRDIGWEWERDLESQGHGDCWRVSHIEEGIDSFEAGKERGHGAQTSRRSDVRIYEDVCDLLLEHSMVDATKVEVEVVEGVVVLRGQVCTRQEIVLCYQLVEDVAGVSRQEILLRIRPYQLIRWEDIGDDVEIHDP